MLLVTNLDYLTLLRESNFDATTFELKVCYDTLDALVSKKCSKIKSAEMYWSGNSNGICNYLRNKDITPVTNVNPIQEDMKILQVFNEEHCLYIHINKIKN